MTELVFIDTETTSLQPNRLPWEIGLIYQGYDDRLIAPVTIRRNMFVALPPACIRAADETALSIGGYWDRFPHDVEPCDEPDSIPVVWTPHRAALLLWHLLEGKTLVGANPAFDAHALNNLFALARKTGPSPWHYRLYDVELLTYGALHREIGGLAHCAEALNIDTSDLTAHTALDDAVLTERIWNRVGVQRRED